MNLAKLIQIGLLPIFLAGCCKSNDEYSKVIVENCDTNNWVVNNFREGYRIALPNNFVGKGLYSKNDSIFYDMSNDSIHFMYSNKKDKNFGIALKYPIPNNIETESLLLGDNYEKILHIKNTNQLESILYYRKKYSSGRLYIGSDSTFNLAANIDFKLVNLEELTCILKSIDKK